MDGMKSDNQQIFVLGATNRLDLIDSALLRPGRYSSIFFFVINNILICKKKFVLDLIKVFTLELVMIKNPNFMFLKR